MLECDYLELIKTSVARASSDDLKELLNNDDKLNEAVDTVLQPMEAEKDHLLSENRNKAEDNISKEPMLIEARSKVTELLDEGKSRCESIQEKLTEIKNKSGNTNPDAAMALLQTAAAESEEESEKLVKDFTDNGLAVEAFLEQFLSIRKTMHLRKFKAEKMADLIKDQKSSQNRNLPYQNSYPASGFYPNPSHFGPSGGIGGLPYPIGPISMPGIPRPY